MATAQEVEMLTDRERERERERVCVCVCVCVCYARVFPHSASLNLLFALLESDIPQPVSHPFPPLDA